MLEAELPISRLGLDRRSLFIVGHGRSGTSNLMVIFNRSPDIYLFGEASFCVNHQRPDFLQRYHEQQRSYGNPVDRSSYYPDLRPRADDSLQGCLGPLYDRFKWVGEKVAITHELLAFSPDVFFAFHERNFFMSRYFFTLRRPTAIIQSAMKTFNSPHADFWARSVARVMCLFLDMYRVFPFVYPVFHEQISVASFTRMGELLELDLRHGIHAHAPEKTKAHGGRVRTKAGEALDRCYARLAAFFDPAKLRMHVLNAECSRNAAGYGAAHFDGIQAIYKDLQNIIAELPCVLPPASTGV